MSFQFPSFFRVQVYAGVTGKIAGKVTEAETGEELIGINILIEGTTLGTTTNIDGTYVINNIEPEYIH